MAVDDYVLLDPSVLECPYPYYEALRTEAPVHLSSLGFWLVSGYDDVLNIVRDPERFSSRMPFNMMAGEPSDALKAALAESAPPVDTLLTNDPPSHNRFRALVSRVFTPRAVTALEPMIREVIRSFLDPVNVTVVDGL